MCSCAQNIIILLIISIDTQNKTCVCVVSRLKVSTPSGLVSCENERAEMSLQVLMCIVPKINISQHMQVLNTVCHMLYLCLYSAEQNTELVLTLLVSFAVTIQ